MGDVRGYRGIPADDPKYLEAIGDAVKLRDRARELGLDMGAAGDADDDFVTSGYNGFGPDRWDPGRRATMSRRFSTFLPAVLVHDIDYARGGSQKDRISADERLRRNIARIIARQKWYDRMWQRPLLDPVMLLVDKQGKPGWHERAAIASRDVMEGGSKPALVARDGDGTFQVIGPKGNDEGDAMVVSEDEAMKAMKAVKAVKGVKSAAYRAGFAYALRKFAAQQRAAIPPQGVYSVLNPPSQPRLSYAMPPEVKSTGFPGLSGKGAPRIGLAQMKLPGIGGSGSGSGSLPSAATRVS